MSYECEPGVDKEVFNGLRHFSLVTHGFGTPTITTAINVFHRYLEELLQSQDSKDNDGGPIGNGKCTS